MSLDVKKRLKDKLDSLTIAGLNRKFLCDYFGEDNLKRLPFKNVRFSSKQPLGWDGYYHYNLNIETGETSSECDIAKGEPWKVEQYIADVEKIIFEKLDEIESK